MGIAGIPRYLQVFRSNGDEYSGNTAGTELEIAVRPREWN